MTQPVLMHSFEDEFEIPEGHQLVALAVSGYIIMKCDFKYNLTPEQQTKYFSGIGKHIHLMQWA